MNKYLTRMLVFSLLLGALPTVIIGILSYMIAADDVEEKVNQGNLHLLNQTQMRVEQTMRSMENGALQFEKSSLVKTLMNQPLASKDFIDVRKLMNEMFALQSQAVLNQVYLINLDYHWSVDLSGLKQLEAGEAERRWGGLLRKQDSIFWNTEMKTVTNRAGAGAAPEASESVQDRVHTIQLIHKIPLLPRSSRPSGLLMLQINAEELRGVLKPRDRDMLANQFILSREGNAFLSSAAEKERYAAINEAVMREITQEGKKQGAFLARAGGTKVSVIYSTSVYNGWSYVSVVPLDKVTRETRKIAVLTAAVCLLLLGAVLMLAFLGSRRMYKPIRRLREYAGRVHPEQNAAPCGREDELEFIHSSLNSLAHSKEQLDRRMRTQSVHLREFYVLKLVTGQMTGDDEMYRSGWYGYPAGWKRLGVLTLEIDNIQDTRFQEQDRELLLFAVSNIVAELLPESTRFTPIVINKAQVTLVTSNSDDPQECREHFYLAAEQIKEKAEQVLGLHASIGISRPFRKLPDTVHAYEESLAALSSRFSLGSDIIVHFEDVENSGNGQAAVYTGLRTLEDRLATALKDQQLEQAEQIFRQYLEEILGKPQLLREHHLLLIQLATKVLKVVQEQGVSVHQVLGGDKEIKMLLRLQTREEITHWFRTRLFMPTIELLSGLAETRFVNIAHKMTRMIHEQYDQDLSLEYCASVMNFHPVYLSRVFKKEMGVTYSEYLTDYRMNQAKRMLETTDMKISEIGEKIRYTNISAFIRTFRKTFGMTPGKYRETQNHVQHP